MLLYHQWANRQIIRYLQRLTPEDWDTTVSSSFNSVRRTVMHLWDAEKIWLLRLQGVSPQGNPGTGFTGDHKDLMAGWQATTQEVTDWLSDKQDKDMVDMVAYTNMRGESFRQPVYEIILHLINHGTYHRGQLITLIRQIGYVDGLPATDMIGYWRMVMPE